MNAFIRRTGVVLLGAFFLSVAPGQVFAQSTNQPKSSARKEEKKPSPHPFHGKLNGVDKTARTISVGKSTYHITAETKVQKGGKPATLDDAVVGEQVGGYVKPSPDGRMIATTVTFGPKPEAKSAKKGK